MAKKYKPSSPAEALRKAAERRSRETEVGRLTAQGAKVTTDRTGCIISAWRSNAFNLLLERGCISTNQHDAAYRLSLDWAAWKRLDGAPDQPAERVDGQSCLSRALVTDRMLNAGSRIAEVMRSIRRTERLVLEAMMVATVEEDRPMQWRGVIERVTGVTDKDDQRDLVVSALEALRDHYERPKTQDRVAA